MSEAPAPPPKSRFRKRRFMYPALVLGAYAAWLVTLYFVQDRMIFPRHMIAELIRPRGTPAGVEEMWIEPEKGVRVEAWFVRAEECTPATPGPAVIFIHGNAELIDDQLGVAREYLKRGISVLLPEFRGYGKSGGAPSQAAICADMIAFHDWLANRPDVQRDRIVLHGRSIGGAVAAQVALQRTPAAMILESAPASLVPYAHRMGAPGWLLRHPFRTAEALAGYHGPLLLMHGTSDNVVPVGDARTLHAVAPQSRLVIFDGGHNDLNSDADAVWMEIDRFLEQAGLRP